MREIKFRGWLAKSKVMLDWDDIQDYWSKEWYGSYAKVISMQYTGLRDKNGVEIYEGDVLRDPIISDDEICEVVWREWDAGFATRSKDDDRLPEHDSLRKRCDLMEVIGNIYENPELLEQTNE